MELIVVLLAALVSDVRNQVRQIASIDGCTGCQLSKRHSQLINIDLGRSGNPIEIRWQISRSEGT
jgi:hypothetical protein